MTDSDHWVPFDEDDNSSVRGSDGDNDDAQYTDAIRKEQHDFISSTCIINAEYASIEIHGADLNTKIICQLFEQIHDRLIQIATDNHIKAAPITADEPSVFDITAALSEMQQPFISFRLIYVAMTSDTLSLLSNIIHLCCESLRDIELELMIPIIPSNSNENNNKLQITGLFHEIMRKCSSLPALEGIGIDLINFPLECYAYFSYFDDDSFASLKTLRVFICKENSTKDDAMRTLLRFIECHEYLDAIRLIVNDIEDDGIWDELLSVNWNDTARFELFEGDVCRFNTICVDIITALNRSAKRCDTLKAFSFCHYLSDDIRDYLDILSLFLSKHTALSELSIVFNCMSDVYLSKLLRAMHETRALMHHLEYLELDSTKLHDFELSNGFEIQQFIEQEALQEEKEENDDNINATTKYKHCKDINIRQKHFGRESVLQLARLLSQCDTLIGLEMKCFYGMDVTAFAALTQSIIAHGTLSKVTLNSLQRTSDIFTGLRDIFCGKQYSFLCALSIEFNRHYLDALRREKYTIPESFYQTLNNSEDLHSEETDSYDEIEKQLRPHCELDQVLRFVDSVIESQFNLLRYIDALKRSLSGNAMPYALSSDVVRIIVDYVVFNETDQEENSLIISLQSLPNDIKSTLRQYFIQNYTQKHSKWKHKVKRMIQINSCSPSRKLMMMNDGSDACQYDHDEEDASSFEFDPID